MILIFWYIACAWMATARTSTPRPSIPFPGWAAAPPRPLPAPAPPPSSRGSSAGDSASSLAAKCPPKVHRQFHGFCVWREIQTPLWFWREIRSRRRWRPRWWRLSSRRPPARSGGRRRAWRVEVQSARWWLRRPLRRPVVDISVNQTSYFYFLLC